MKGKPELTSKDHADMDIFLGHVLDDYKAAKITKQQAIAALAHVMAALDLDNYGEARSWFENGRLYLQEQAGHYPAPS